jgi:phenylacetate-CoA ligase
MPAETSDDPPGQAAYWDNGARQLGLKGERIDLEASIPTEGLAERIAAWRPHVLELPSPRLDDLLRLAQKRGVSLGLDTIVTFGAPVSNEVRRACREAFGAQVVDYYACAELGIVAIQCPSGGVHHAMSDAFMVEILSEDGRPVPVGATGRVVVTPFHNFAMPLVRYDTGDLATSASPCSCGRSLHVLRDIRRPTAG